MAGSLMMMVWRVMIFRVGGEIGGTLCVQVIVRFVSVFGLVV